MEMHSVHAYHKKLLKYLLYCTIAHMLAQLYAICHQIPDGEIGGMNIKPAGIRFLLFYYFITQYMRI